MKFILIVKDNKIYELFKLICSILFSIMFMQHTFNSFYDLVTMIWIHYAYNNYIYNLVPCFLLRWPPFWCTSGHASKATFQLWLHYINLIIRSLQIHSGTKVNFSFIWLHQTFKWMFQHAKSMGKNIKLHSIKQNQVWSTCSLIDPDKLNVPDDSLSVVKDSMTVLVNR